MATEQAHVVGFGPDQFVQKGLPSDIDIRVTKSRWAEWNYGGAVSADRMAIAVCLEFRDLATDEEFEQYLSAGSLGNFKPNPKDDGKTLTVTKGEGELARDSNWHHFMKSLWSKGWPADPTDPRSGSSGDVSILEGADIHIQRVKAPERAGLKREPRKKDYEDQILVVTNIIKLPWEQAKTAAKGGRKAAPATAHAAATPSPAANGDAGDSPELILKAVVEAAAGKRLKADNLKFALIKYDNTMDAASRDALIAQWTDQSWFESISESIQVVFADGEFIGA